MRLSQLVADLPIAGDAARGAGDPEVTGVSHDSRRVEPGDLFVAWPGERFDGAAFAPQAVLSGAVAVLAADRAGSAGIAVPWLTADDPHALLAPLAAGVYRHPDRELLLAGITGTNGKSTVTALVARILEAAGHPAGVVGTLGHRFRDLAGRTGRTTPEASDLFRTLRRMRDAGAAAVAMEVSSHALALGRVEGAGFDLALFTNLTRDHLDFHGGLEEYYAAKHSLFDRLKPGGVAAVNLDDPFGRRLAEELPAALTFGAGGAVSVARAELDADGIRGVFAVAEGAAAGAPAIEIPFASPLIGRFNLANLLAAAAGAVALGLPADAVTAGIAAQPPLPGRLEPVRCGQPFAVYVDFAHTPAALEAALGAVRELGAGELIAVFGCGGDRDPGKRPLMGKVAGELADLPVVTSDNPRSEDPMAIVSAVEAGVRQSGNQRYRVVPDRREAIRRAIAVAAPGAAVLVAGRGDERVQIVGAEELPFVDRDEIVHALEERYGETVRC